jgi:hypothetical protein
MAPPPFAHSPAFISRHPAANTDVHLLINHYATFLRLLASLGCHRASRPGKISPYGRVTLKLFEHPGLGLRAHSAAISGKPVAT